MKILTRSDEILMLAILRLKDNAYGVSIIKEIEKRTGKKLTFGSLWVSMDILHKRGFVKKRMADPTPQRGGRRKIYYSLTSKGISALEEAREFQESLWEGVPARLKT
ncbi:MAG: PadR family transcriptional regulator [Candidatus Aminicenantaceae bacterium]|jgi:PadR family transcriptional regulator PadR